MPEDKHKWKGRFCYRAPTVRDEGGALAVFQEISARPVAIIAVNITIAYGCLPGHMLSTADAVRAYVQSNLESKHPTYIEFPKHLIPKKWSHLKRPVVRLIKALYGHPEAGGHWERHLTKIVLKLGAVRVPSNPSCFFFKSTKLLLTIYVDDLLLSGPKDAHAPFWAKLEEEVNIDPWEKLDRFIGRHHKIVDCEGPGFDITEAFVSPVDLS